jgi:rare lipoprotein A
VPYRQGGEGRSPVPSKVKSLDPASVKASNDTWKKEMEGLASWYGDKFHGRLTASGEVYDMHQLTAAHKTLPLGTVVKVTRPENGKSVEVRVNDRGPFVAGRVIDLSRAAAKVLGLGGEGLARVRLEVKRWPR